MGLEKGIVIEPMFGLVLPNTKNPEKLFSKVASSLEDVKLRVSEAKAQGKHILYLPGSYDLVHKGHAFYVAQV